MDQEYQIRLETEKDYYETETLTREAFWNKYRPGCQEHYILHRYRTRPDFVKELDYVLEKDGRLIAHIMYSHAQIKCEDGSSVPVMMFGPVSVLPDDQRKGYGSALIQFTLDQARNLGCGAVLITGDPGYYHRFGFVSGQSKNIFYGSGSAGDMAPFFLVKELIPGFLNGISGTFLEPAGYIVDDAAVDVFDSKFPPKEKQKLPGQLA